MSYLSTLFSHQLIQTFAQTLHHEPVFYFDRTFHNSAISSKQSAPINTGVASKTYLPKYTCLAIKEWTAATNRDPTKLYRTTMGSLNASLRQIWSFRDSPSLFSLQRAFIYIQLNIDKYQANQKQGTAHLRMFISGFSSLAIAYNTSMLVRRVANCPSNFIEQFLMRSSISLKSLVPSSCLSSILSRMENNSQRDRQQFLNWWLEGCWTILCPWLMEREQIILAHDSGSCEITDRMKLMKLLRSSSSILITIPVSMRVTITFFPYFLSISATSSSSASESSYSCLKIGVLMYILMKAVSILLYTFRKKSCTLYKRPLYFLSLMLTKMFPPWQSA